MVALVGARWMGTWGSEFPSAGWLVITWDRRGWTCPFTPLKPVQVDLKM